MIHYKPYPAYKDSGIEWTGEVPEHWNIAQFKRLVSINNGTDHKAIETNAENGFPVYGSGGIFAYATSYIYDGESVLLGRKGTIDKPLYVNGKFWTVDTMYWTKIMPNAYGKFCYYVATTIPFNYYATNTALPSMTQTDLGSHMIAFPGHDEQKDIAAAIDTETTRIDNLIAKKTSFIELLKEKRQAFITHAVTKGLDPDVPMKDSGVEWIGEVPEHWDVKRLRHVAMFNNSNVDKKSYEDQNQVKLCNYTDVYYNEFITPDLDFMDATASDSEVEKFRLKKGDVIITKDSEDPSDIGIPTLVMCDMDDVVCGYHLTVIKAHERDLSGFIHRSIQAHSTKAHFFVESPGITRFGLDQDAIGDIPICVPPKEERVVLTEAINKETTRIDTLIDKTQRSIELLKERRSAFITAAVTGQIDLREEKQ